MRMGEVNLSSEEKGMEVELKTGEERKREDDTSSGSADVVRWEEFLPKMVIRVLLVEADDSTRQIIAALLRKCSYKVSAVPDGLQAWEILRERPQSIDIVLTELDVPAISGYALLTLAMEHEICKNIPFIIMSSQNSISMVLKCMLKGAADFLIKPIRKNELRNLWQHVWRRQSHTAQDVSEKVNHVEQKDEASSENGKASNNSSGFVATSKKSKEYTEKGSDAQSTCTTAYMEAESAYMPNVQVVSQFRCSPETNKNEKLVIMNAERAMPESSFRRSSPGSTSLHHRIVEQHMLNHSDYSPFSRYESRKTPPSPSPSPSPVLASGCTDLQDENKSYQVPPKAMSRNSGCSKETVHTSQGFMFNLFVRQSGQPELASATQEQNGLDQTNESEDGADGHLPDKLKSEGQIMREDFPLGAQVIGDRCDTITENSVKINLHKSISDGAAEKVTAPETCDLFTNDQFKSLDARPSSQRAAALMKFRMKRKDRCFEKKVRYESRKRMAEQRPRVKGQFVRQTQVEQVDNISTNDCPTGP